MVTKQQLKEQLKAELEKEGYKVELLKQWPARATYYKKDGEPMTNLPADPYSMQRYLKKGFTLTPPQGAVAPKRTWSRKKKEIINDVDDQGKIIQVPIEDYRKSLEED